MNIIGETNRNTTLSRPTSVAAERGWLNWPAALGVPPAALVLTGILILAAFLNFYQLQNIGDGNLYYTAAVESMLQSWDNFFFVAAEPGGSVTVDKPPLGLWIEAASAFVFGVNGFAVVLPNIIAGLLSILIVYHLTKNCFGTAAGLVAALAVAVTPVAVAAQRNNTMDSLLTFSLVLAAWAFLKAAETGKLRHLLLGALLIGLGFNIKMMQAFLPVPAFYAVYFLGAKTGWPRKILNLGVATLLLLVVSLSWALVVDAVPADQRPYIGSSANNTVMELILGHNGLNRWSGGGGNRADDGDGGNGAGQRPIPTNDGGQFAPPPPNDGGRFAPPANGNAQFAPPADGQLPPSPPNGAGGGRPSGSSEVGEAGVMRFFEAPLSKEASWLLPFAVVAALLLLFRRRLTWPVSPRRQFLLVWGGWLAISWVFFSFAGLFHAYYLVMLAPPLGALAGAGAAELWQMRRRHGDLAAVLLVGTAVITLLFQWFNANQFVDNVWLWGAVSAAFLLMGGVLLAVQWRRDGRYAQMGFVLILLSLMVTPLVWTYLTTTDVNNTNLPGAYAGVDEFAAPDRNNNRGVDTALLAYLQANTQDAEYLLAVPSSMQGTAYVLETGRPVLYMGGFSGGDPVVNADDIAQMVADGDLSFVMIGGGRGRSQQGVSEWAQANCAAVTQFNAPSNRPPGANGGNLYQCG